jgi:hypothetical protein
MYRRMCLSFQRSRFENTWSFMRRLCVACVSVQFRVVFAHFLKCAGLEHTWSFMRRLCVACVSVQFRLVH